MKKSVKKFANEPKVKEIYRRYYGDFAFLWALVISNFTTYGIKEYVDLTDEDIEDEVKEFAETHHDGEEHTDENGKTYRTISIIQDYNVRDMLVMCRILASYDIPDVIELLNHRWTGSEF